MDLNDAEKLITSGKKRPCKTLFNLLILFVLIAIISFVTQYCGEKGKQKAGVSESINQAPPTPKMDESASTIPVTPAPSVSQKTHGEQSPAINSGRDVKLKYGK